MKRYPTKHRAQKGELIRFVLGALRTAQKPVTSLELTLALMERRKLRADDATVVLMRKRVGACLTSLRQKGIIADVPQAGEYKAWRLA